MYIPEGFGTIVPNFAIKDADKFVEFLKVAFGGVEIGRNLHPGGTIAHVQVRIGTTTIMASESSEYCPAMANYYYLYVENADETMKAAIENGATLKMEVDDRPYGDRQGGITDPFGNIWWVSQRLVDEPYNFS